MITIKDILTVINTILNDNFPDVDIQSNDVKGGFNRPSFFTDIEDYESSNITNKYKEESLTIMIYYYPSNKNKNSIELLEMQEMLEGIFIENIKINEDFYVVIDQTSVDVIDGVLEFSFDLNYVQQLEDTDETDLMEELDFDINI